MPAYKYKAFISYSHKDKRWARWLHRGLESYRVPERLVRSGSRAGSIPKRLSPIFRDREDLASSHNLTDRINDALEKSASLIVICSPDAAASPWVNREIEVFSKLGRSDQIFCLIVDGDPTAISTNLDCFPPALRQSFDASGNLDSGQTEPVGADVRKTADGPALARQKIIAGMLDVGLDDLRQRELLRRHRRMAVITAASLAALLLTALLALNAYFARNEANQRRAQAEELLTFMVGDLRDNLEPIGRLDLLEKVGESAMRYFSSVDVDTLMDSELIRQAQVLTQIGEIRISQKEYEGALNSFNEAFERSAALYRNKDSDGERLFERSQAEFWVGYVHWRRGKLDDARLWLTRYLESAQALANLDPNRDDWAIEIAYGHHNLAVLAVESGQFLEAKNGFNGELEILLELQERSPSDTNDRYVADAISWLGKIALMQGELVSARENYARSSLILERLTGAAPDNKIRRHDWAHGVLLNAEVTAIVGELDQALSYAEQAATIFGELIWHDTENKEWQLSGANATIEKGNILAALGSWDEASVLVERSVATLESMIASGAADLSVQSHLGEAFMLRSWIQQAAGDAPTALVSNQVAIDTLKQIEESNRLNDVDLARLAYLYVDRGQLLVFVDKKVEAERAWQLAIDLLLPKAEATRSHVFLDPWVRVLILRGNSNRAEELIQELNANGYRPLRPWPD